MRGGDVESASAAELDGHYFEDLAVGMTDVYSRTVTESDIAPFCGISGGANPLRLEQEDAAGARFGGTIARGMPSASFISTVLGAELPGPGAICVGRNRRFRAPVRAGDTMVARPPPSPAGDDLPGRQQGGDRRRGAAHGPIARVKARRRVSYGAAGVGRGGN